MSAENKALYATWERDFQQMVGVWAGDCSLPNMNRLLYLPDLLALLLALSHDQRLSADQRAACALRSERTLNGLEDLPQNFVSAGVLEGDLAKVLRELKSLLPNIPTEVWREHWQNAADLPNLLETLSPDDPNQKIGANC